MAYLAGAFPRDMAELSFKVMTTVARYLHDKTKANLFRFGVYAACDWRFGGRHTILQLPLTLGTIQSAY